jgi:hypothetical protein
MANPYLILSRIRDPALIIDGLATEIGKASENANVMIHKRRESVLVIIKSNNKWYNYEIELHKNRLEVFNANRLILRQPQSANLKIMPISESDLVEICKTINNDLLNSQ